MAWARIDDNFFNHPKVYKAGKDAVLFHIAALCHSNAFLTEGFIEDAILDLIGKQSFQKHPAALAEKLVEVELWERVEGGYYIHDFLKYNHSKAEVEQIKSKKSYAGSLGGRPTSKAEQKQTESTMKAKEKQTESHTQPIPIPIPIKELKDSTAAAFSGKNTDLYVQFQTIAEITPQAQKAIDSAVNIYSAGWVRDAIAEAAGKGKTFGYVNSILDRWKREGRNGNGKRLKPISSTVDDFRKLYDQQKASEK